MTPQAPTPPLRPAGPGAWRGLLLGYLYLAALWLAARWLPHGHAAWAAAAVLLLASPMVLALWHQHTVRRLIALHQFADGRRLHRFGSRRALGLVWRALLALLLTSATLAQAVFFDTRDWLLLALAPALLAAAQHMLQARAAMQFRAPVYHLRWSLWLASWTVALLLAAAWVALQRLDMDGAAPPDLLDHVHALQRRWAEGAPGLVIWALDLAAWGQATVAALGQATQGVDGWRIALGVLVAPLALFGHVALSLAGLSLPAAELRRTLAAGLNDAAHPPPLAAGRRALWACMAVIAAMLWFQSIAWLNAALRQRPSPFAVVAVPECERIAGQAYRLNTSYLLDTLMAATRQRLATQQAAACTQLDAIAARTEAGIDAYLDWYFSLGAEWARIATMLTGDVELWLQARFQNMVLADPALTQQLDALQAAQARHWQALDTARADALAALEHHRLVLDERGCRATLVQSEAPWLAQIDAGHGRLAAGSAAGLAAGAIAAQLTAKAMGKASMKTAGTLLLKAAAKKAAGQGAAAAAGAAIGSVVPGVGTLVGAVTGLAIGTAVDVAALAAEEGLTRADMRRDLLDAVAETLHPYRTLFGCG